MSDTNEAVASYELTEADMEFWRRIVYEHWMDAGDMPGAAKCADEALKALLRVRQRVEPKDKG